MLEAAINRDAALKRGRITKVDQEFIDELIGEGLISPDTLIGGVDGPIDGMSYDDWEAQTALIDAEHVKDLEFLRATIGKKQRRRTTSIRRQALTNDDQKQEASNGSKRRERPTEKRDHYLAEQKANWEREHPGKRFGSVQLARHWNKELPYSRRVSICPKRPGEVKPGMVKKSLQRLKKPRRQKRGPQSGFVGPRVPN